MPQETVVQPQRTAEVAKETVEAEEILELEKAGVQEHKEFRRLTPIQQAGMQLALGVGLAIALATSAVIGDWLLTRPDLPSFPAGTKPEDAARVIQNFKEINVVHLERATSLFDLIVVKAFLPVFTAILGYIFGTRADGGGTGAS
jgi:hypothetical protein